MPDIPLVLLKIVRGKKIKINKAKANWDIGFRTSKSQKLNSNRYGIMISTVLLYKPLDLEIFEDAIYTQGGVFKYIYSGNGFSPGVIMQWAKAS